MKAPLTEIFDPIPTAMHLMLNNATGEGIGPVVDLNLDAYAEHGVLHVVMNGQGSVRLSTRESGGDKWASESPEDCHQSGSFLVKLSPQMRLVYDIHAGRVIVNLHPLTKR